MLHLVELLGDIPAAVDAAQAAEVLVEPRCGLRAIGRLGEGEEETAGGWA